MRINCLDQKIGLNDKRPASFPKKMQFCTIIHQITSVMNVKQILVGFLILAMLGFGFVQFQSDLAIISSNAFSLIGIIVVVALLGYGAYRILRD